MNRIEFYNKLDKARVQLDELRHSGEYGTYYNKIEKYYPDGRARYFQTKAEWDAYQEGLAREKQRQQNEIKRKNAEAANHEGDRYNKPKGNSDYKVYGFKGDKSDIKEMRETYNKNRDAANNSEQDRWNRVKIQNEQKETMEKANKQVMANPKLSQDVLNKISSGVAKEDIQRQIKEAAQDYKNTNKPAEFRKENLAKNIHKNAPAAEAEGEREEARRKGEAEANKKIADNYKQQKETKKKNEEAAKAMEKAEKEKQEKLRKKNNPVKAKTREEVEREAINKTVAENQKAKEEANKSQNKKLVEQYTDELNKLKGQLNLIENRKFSQTKDLIDYNKLKKQVEEKENQLKKAKDDLAEERRINAEKIQNNRDAAIKENIGREQENYKAQQEYAEKMSKMGKSIEEQKRKEAKEREQFAEWKEENKDKINDMAIEIYDQIRKCAKDRQERFTLDNELVDLFKERLKENDPDFNGDIAAYVRPWAEAPEFAKKNDWGWFEDEGHAKIAKETLEEVENILDKAIDKVSIEDGQYSDYLDKLSKARDTKRVKAIDDEMKTVRSSLESMYNGDDDKVEMDKDLLKILEKKIKQIDPEYKRGKLYNYIRPHILGKWIKDDESYNIVMDALNELEKELRSANSKDDAYGDYISKISKLSL